MGGNAFENTDRLSAAEYDEMTSDLSWSLRNVMGEGTKFAIPFSVREKESHGDVDILVVGSMIEKAYGQINLHFRPTDVIKNPNGYNLLVPFKQKLIQVDLNKIGDDDLVYGFHYFSWNDCGNLVGRIAHRQGLKHGHDGLWYIHRDGDHQLGEILLTRDYTEALYHLGFDADEFFDGFDTFDQMFTWVEKSRYFEPSAFPLEHRNHQARVRDSKRKTYQAFLKRINFDGEYVPANKDFHLERHKRRWPHLKQQLFMLNLEYGLDKEAKEKLNGKIVMELTGLSGKPLGELMQYVKRVLPRELVLKLEPKSIEAGILFAYEMYKAKTL